MDYREEIINIINGIAQEHTLRFFYAMLRVVTSDPDSYEESIATLSESIAILSE